MDSRTEEMLATFRKHMEEHTAAEHEFKQAEMDLFYVLQANLAGQTALVLGKLVAHVEALRSYLQDDIALLKPSDEKPENLPARTMAEALGAHIDEFCRTSERVRQGKIIYHAMLIALRRADEEKNPCL